LVKRADSEDEVFYVDEADIDLNPRIGTTYMRRGKQLVVLTPGKNVKRYVAGALNARTGKVVHVVRERKNSDLFIELVEEICRRYRRARRIHLVLDNFIIHKSKRTLRWLALLGDRVVLHFLPPYLAAVERHRAAPVENVVPISQPLAALGRSLEDYAAVIGGAA
jgi:transposase